MRRVEPRALPQLRRRLRRGRARARGVRMVEAGSWSFTVAAGVALVAAIANAAGWPLSAGVRGGVAAAVAVFALVALALAWLRAPGLAALARRADARFGLQERASTALELATDPSRSARGPAADAVAVALLADAERHAERIVLRQLVPLQMPRTAWLALVLTAATIALPRLSLPPASAPIVAPADMGGPLGAAERDVAVTELGRAAELLARTAEREEDPYLRALAQAFEELRESVGTGAVDLAEYRSELGRLLEHAERALGPGTLADEGTEGSPEEAPARSAATRPDEVTSFSLPEGGEPPPGQEAEAGAGPDGAAGGDRTLSKLLEGLEQIEAEFREQEAARRARGGTTTEVKFEYGSVGSQERPASAEAPPGTEGLAGAPAGAAEDAGRGAGDMAGHGTADVEGAEASPSLAGADDPEEVLLPGAAVEDGERVRVERAPEVGGARVEDAPEATVDPPAANEAQVRRDRIGPRDRGIVSRYFARDEAGQARAPDAR